MKKKDINDIIREYLEPIPKSECERLGVSKSFIAGIYGAYLKALLYSSYCRPIKQNGQIQAVQICIGCTIRGHY